MHTSTVYNGSVEVCELLTFIECCGDAGKQAIHAAAYERFLQPHIAVGERFLKATLVFTPGTKFNTLNTELTIEFADTAKQEVS